MAEPVGITGTAVGIVSFGLQLYTGISEYLDAVKGRDEDLQTAKQYAKILRDNLGSIEETIGAIGSEYAVARYAIEQCPMVDPTNRTEQVKKCLRKLSYPFKKKDITRLQDRLSLTNNVLHTAALALQLAISNNTCATIVNLQKMANVIYKTTEDTASHIAKQNIALEQASQTMSKSHQEFQLISQRISTSLDTRIDDLVTHLRNSESPRSQIIHLLEYPDDLRRLCDAVSNLHQSSKANARTPAIHSGATSSRTLADYKPCACTTRKDLRRHGRRLGFTFYEIEAEKTAYHAPECHLSGIIPTAEERQDHRVQHFLFGQMKQLEVFQIFPEIANNLGFNPLHIAIIEQDEDRVQSFLNRYPSYVNEVNYCGQSPVHVAIQTKNLHIITAVVLAANADILNAADNGGESPIHMAVSMACPLHHFLNPNRQQPCAQARIVDRLLKSKAMLLNSLMGERFNAACQPTQMIILGHLAQRRRDLELLAVSELSAVELQGLGLCNGHTLDRNTATVQHYLANHCRVPAELLFYREDDVSTHLDHSESIYQYIYNLDVAEYAMSLGFHTGTMLSEFFSDLIHDIAFNGCFGDYGVTFGYRSFPMRVNWMIDHGADIATAIPTGSTFGVVPKSTWAHYLMALFGFGARWGRNLSWELPRNVAEIGASEVVVDGCLCWCSRQGCMPLVKFLAALDFPRVPGRSPEDLGAYAMRASKVLEKLLPGYRLGELHYGWIYHAILRYITFSALDLRHTCCEMANKGSNPIMDAEEVREIHEADAVQLQMLEELVSDFEIEHESDFDLVSFLRGTWVPKMQHVCAELYSSQLTYQETTSAERIGVVWQVRESEVTCYSGVGHYGDREGRRLINGSIPQIDRTEDDKPTTLAEWMRQLDDTAIDPERPVITM
ncbi:uncharacterized protein FTJAE_10226 [Fusarium tjaetaba]|uniref:Fungal N-terminal domain-containing protein n=1 Tax=Fusarium tjaetaba TaxID=1567544 RepID=A0A8H5VJL2_9HYPO|nr:uncharacterized protein FTJAE_10226 [Fusarium tjaetaba]KAF5624633.1 hypothetical protein FTJAE_10226 [Fusarium tjaetaba]